MTMSVSPPDIMQIGTLYTVGYSNPADRSRLDQLMQDPRRLLVDIRFSPRSRPHPDFCREQLHTRFNVTEQAHLPEALRRVRYIWYQALGNRNYANGKSIHLDDPERGIPQVVASLREGRDVILLCACSDERRCHRLLVARLVQDALAALL